MLCPLTRRPLLVRRVQRHELRRLSARLPPLQRETADGVRLGLGRASGLQALRTSFTIRRLCESLNTLPPSNTHTHTPPRPAPKQARSFPSSFTHFVCCCCCCFVCFVLGFKNNSWTTVKLLKLKMDRSGFSCGVVNASCVWKSTHWRL